MDTIVQDFFKQWRVLFDPCPADCGYHLHGRAGSCQQSEKHVVERFGRSAGGFWDLEDQHHRTVSGSCAPPRFSP